MWEQKSEKVSSLEDTEHGMTGHGWLDGDTDRDIQTKNTRLRGRDRVTNTQEARFGVVGSMRQSIFFVSFLLTSLSIWNIASGGQPPSGLLGTHPTHTLYKSCTQTNDLARVSKDIVHVTNTIFDGLPRGTKDKQKPMDHGHPTPCYLTCNSNSHVFLVHSCVDMHAYPNTFIHVHSHPVAHNLNACAWCK